MEDEDSTLMREMKFPARRLSNASASSVGPLKRRASSRGSFCESVASGSSHGDRQSSISFCGGGEYGYEPMDVSSHGRRRNSLTLGDLASMEAEDRTKRRRLMNRRNSKTPAMLLSSIKKDKHTEF